MLLPDDQPKADLHPDRLRALAILLGLPVPTAVEHSAILVLGVSLGSNLLALACEYPQASFTAMCMNQRELNQLQAACRHLGLHNIQLLLSEDIPAKHETGFDYILCHGYYSYLQEADKEALLHHISLNLRACTLFCVSYLRHRWPRKRSSKCIVNQFMANLQFWIGIVHFFDAFITAK